MSNFSSKKGNEIFFKDFLSSLLELNIFKIEIVKNSNLARQAIDDKLCILDIKATLNDNTIIDIEMQLANQNNIMPRTVYYSSKLITSQLSKGENYNLLKPVIVISILDFNFLPFDEYITETMTVSNTNRNFEISKYQKYYFIELPKFRKSLKNLDNNKVVQWLPLLMEKIIKEWNKL